MRSAVALLLTVAFAMCAARGADLKPVDEAAYPKLVDAWRGKVVLVNFWATYCVPCREEMPRLVALAARLRPRGFAFVTISADEPEQLEAAKHFLDQVKAPAAAYIKRAHDDDKFIDAIDHKWSGALPASFLYDRQGRKVRSYFGEVDVKAIAAEIEKLL